MKQGEMFLMKFSASCPALRLPREAWTEIKENESVSLTVAGQARQYCLANVCHGS